MIERAQHGDVTSLRFSWQMSRMVGYAVHTFVVRGAMIDTAFPAVSREMTNVLAEERIRGAFITHHHEDHAGNVELLAKRRIPIALDEETLRRVRRPGPIGLYRKMIWTAMTPLSTAIIPFTDESLSLVATPGHCENHHTVWDEATGTLFSGDLFLGVKVRIAHQHENPRALVQSLRSMVARNPARVFCAHRGLVPNGSAALNAKADWLEKLIGESEQLMSAGWSDAAIAKKLVGPRGFTDYFSAGDYSSVNVITSIRLSRPINAPPSAPHAHR